MNAIDVKAKLQEQRPLLVGKRYYVKDGDSRKAYTLNALKVLEVAERDFQVYALLNAEDGTHHAWEINIESLDLFFVQLG